MRRSIWNFSSLVLLSTQAGHRAIEQSKRGKVGSFHREIRLQAGQQYESLLGVANEVPNVSAAIKGAGWLPNVERTNSGLLGEHFKVGGVFLSTSKSPPYSTISGLTESQIPGPEQEKGEESFSSPRESQSGSKYKPLFTEPTVRACKLWAGFAIRQELSAK
jgi:hypothetical protein